MKQRIDMNVEPRETGKHFSRALRNGRRVPAVIYGAVENNFSVSVYEGDIARYHTRAFENALFNIKSTRKELDGKVVLMKAVQVHPVSRRPEHVDFQVLDLTKVVRVSVEVRLEGKPIGLAEGGLLNIVHRQIEVECLPTEIPDAIVADVSHLGVGDALHVSDLKIPDNVKVMTGLEQTVAVVNIQEEEVAAVAAVVDPAAAGATPAAGAAAAPGATPAAGAAAAAGATPAAGAAKKDDKKK